MYTKLTNLNVAGCSALETLYCEGNQLKSLDVSDCTALTYLFCDSNKLKTLDVSKCTALTELRCDSNQLETLDVSKCTALTSLDCDNNKLTSLNISGCTSLNALSCFSNQLDEIDISGIPGLKSARLNGNHSTRSNPAREEFKVDDSNIITIDNATALVFYTVTCKVDHGNWNDKTKDDKEIHISLKADDGNDPVLYGTDFPDVGNEPDSGYKKTGSWDPEKPTAKGISKNESYTFTYEKMDSESLDYVDAEGTPANSPVAFEPVKASDNPSVIWGENGKTIWYAVTEDVTINKYVYVRGNVNLILCDGKTLTAKKGVSVDEGSSLTVWAQSGGTGKLYAGTTNGTDTTCNDGIAGIGGSVGKSGAITINGGTVYAMGGKYAAGIGGGNGYDSGAVIVNGGMVYANGTVRAIGDGYNSPHKSSLKIYAGAKVSAGTESSHSLVEETDGITARVNACWDNQYAIIEPCTSHSWTRYIDITDTTHTSACAYCSTAETTTIWKSWR